MMDASPENALSCLRKRSLVDLPGEIRAMIYEHLFEHATITLTNKTGDKARGPYVWLSSAFAVGFLATCRTFYLEAAPLLREATQLVCRDNARPHQLKLPINGRYARRISTVTILHNPYRVLGGPDGLVVDDFPSLKTLRVEIPVSNYDYGFSKLPGTSSDEDLVEVLRAYVGRLKDRCDWLGEEMRKGRKERQFGIEVVLDMKDCWDWFMYWMQGSTRLAWVSLVLV